MPKSNLPKRYAVKLLSSIVTGTVGIVLVAIVPNALGATAFGQFSFIQQIFSQITAFLDAGTSTAFFTKLSAKTDRKELITVYALFSLILLVALYLGVEGAYVFGLNDAIFPDIPIEYLYLGVYFGFLVWLTQIYIKISDAYVLTVSVEIIKIIHKLLSLLLLFLMISFIRFDLTSYFYFNYISLISFLAIITVVFVKKDIITSNVLVVKIKYTAPAIAAAALQSLKDSDSSMLLVLSADHVIQQVKDITGKDFKVLKEGRRSGDPHQL